MINNEERKILCIDLKSFFASCECVKMGVNPFKFPLVVANKNQGKGAITLAVTPYLKKQGIKSRGRLFEIPKNIKYYIANPHMALYINKSKEVISIYLDFVSDDDLYIYSIDECFLDVTNYLKLYKKNEMELAKLILQTIYDKTGLTATCGIGPNMLLAKIAMDTEAKTNANNIAKWTFLDVPKKLWTLKPLSKMWGIGQNMEHNLNNLGIYSVKDLALSNKYFLQDKFGVMGLELWYHANGIDNSKINEHKKLAKMASFSHSQVLFKDYNENNIKIIIKEMVEVLTERLHKENKLTKSISLSIGYSKIIEAEFHHTLKLDNPTDDAKEITTYCYLIFDKFYEFLPIRKVNISLGNLQDKKEIQLCLFKNNKYNQDININNAIDKIKERYGKNSLIKATSLLKDSTIMERNKKIGGHYL